MRPPRRTAEPEQARDMDRTLSRIGAPTRQTLAALAGAPRQFAQTTLGLLPATERHELEALGVAVSRPIGRTRRGRRQASALHRVELTDWGMRVIGACAEAAEDESPGIAPRTARRG